MKFTPLTEDRLNHLAEIGEATDYTEALQDTQTFIYVGETVTRNPALTGSSAPLSAVFTIYADETFLHGNVYNIAITGCDDNGDPIGAINWYEWALDNGRDDVQNPHEVDFFRILHSDWVEVTDYSIKGYLALIERNGSGRRIKKNKQTTPEPQFTELEKAVIELNEISDALTFYADRYESVELHRLMIRVDGVRATFSNQLRAPTTTKSWLDIEGGE